MSYLESVDNSLRLLLLMSRVNRVGVTEVATELGVAPSTAHRLLSTLRYRGFVVQGKDRSYRAGPAFVTMINSRASRVALTEVAQPHMEALRDATGETCHLVVLSGTQIRFIASVESRRVLRVGIRVGALMPAHLASGGKLLLAELPPLAFAEHYPPAGVPSLGLTPQGITALRRELDVVRRMGYAINVGATERGVAAIAVLIREPDGPVAMSVSIPTVRYSGSLVPDILTHLREAATGISADLER